MSKTQCVETHDLKKKCSSQGHITAQSHLSHFQRDDKHNVSVLLVSQAFLQDLGRGQVTVAAFNELSAHLLREYSTDDTRRIKDLTDKHNAAWNSINNRCL